MKWMNRVQISDGCITNSLLRLRVAVDVQQSDKLLPVKSEWASYNRLRYWAFVSHN